MSRQREVFYERGSLPRGALLHTRRRDDTVVVTGETPPRSKAQVSSTGTNDVDALPMSLTVRQVAALANVSAKTIHNLGARGLVPGRIKIGRATRFNRGAILRWLEGRPAESREGGDGRG